jgi:hypothetical protein
MISQLSQENNLKIIANADENLVYVIQAKLHFRDRSDVAKIRYWQRERKKGDVLLNDTP